MPGSVENVGNARTVKRYLQLATALAGQEFPGAYRGNLTGVFAAIGVPLAMLATYSFVFSTLIPVRIRPGQSTGEYTLFLFSGLVVWNLVADVVVRSPRLFASAGHYVHRSQFPISLLVLAPCLASFYRSLPWLGAYALAHYWLLGTASWTFLAAPFVLFLTMLIALGIGLLLASLGAVLRDLADIVPPVMSLAFFVSPILYPASRLSEINDWVLLLNPVSAPIRIMHSVLSEGSYPPMLLFGETALAALFSIGLGGFVYFGVRGSLQDLV